MKLKTQLAIIFTTITLLIVSAISFIFYIRLKNNTIDQIHAHLASVSFAQETKVHTLLKNKFQLIHILTNNKTLTENLRQYSFEKNQASINDLNNTLELFKNIIPNSIQFHLADQKGTIISSTKASSLGKDISGKEYFSIPRGGKEYFDGFFFNNKNELNVYLSAPVKINDSIIAVLIIQMYAEDIEAVTSDYTGLGKTGETTISRKTTEGISYLTGLRFNKQAALRPLHPLSDTAYVINEAGLLNKDGFYQYVKDYRNKDVIAFTRYISESDWGITTKIDAHEAYEPISFVKNLLISINLLSVLIITVISYIIGRSISRPIEKLTESAILIKEGDFNHRVSIKSETEIGTLATAFNEMADKLNNKITQLNNSVTQLEKAKEDINHKNVELTKTNTDLDNFIYTASHDLKTPISNIEGLINALPETVSKETNNMEEFQLMMKMICTSIDRFKNTIQELNDISKVQRNIPEDETELEIAEILEDVKTGLITEIEISQAIILADLERCPRIIYSKRNFRSIIYNLINNAIKYKSPDRQPVITVSTIRTEEYIILTVTDNGLGIDPFKINQIFGMFKRLHDHVEGTGVGLYIVKRIIENNGGKIAVESEVGKGTIFKIYFKG